MQKLRNEIPAPYPALPLPYTTVSIGIKSNEKRLADWLNGKRLGLDLNGIGELLTYSEGEDNRTYRPPTVEEEECARRRVIEDVLPRVRHMAGIPGHLDSEWPDLTQAESLGVLLGLTTTGPVKRKLASYSAFPHVSERGALVWFVTGPNALEGWAAHVLISMWREGRLSLLKQCDCGCGKWLVKWRKDQRFWKSGCRVRCHQSDAAFKAERREDARSNYAHHKREREKGKLEVGYMRGVVKKRVKKVEVR